MRFQFRISFQKYAHSLIGEVRAVKRARHPKSYLYGLYHADCWELGLQLSFFLEQVLIVDSPYLNKTQVFQDFIAKMS